MTQKELRKYDLITDIANIGGAERLRELAGIDFTAAVEVWEYKLTKDINAFGDIDVFKMLEIIKKIEAEYGERGMINKPSSVTISP